ncbi:MAG TPA: hypothetical protein VGR66_01220 [Candidatus Eisenbacteria bacterium]|jgi:hypothetical protein|nr:hypothetical protein [Candidatus Eisenbacteria bacterium]
MNIHARGIFVASLFLLLVIPVRAWSDCPEACAIFVECCDSDLNPLPPHNFCSTAPSFDQTANSDPNNVWSSGQCVGHMSYDVLSGTLYAELGATFQGCSSAMSLDEDFTVNGLPSGTPVDLTAQLVVIRTMQVMGISSFDFTASLGHGADGTSWHVGTNAALTPPFSTLLTLPLHVLAGTPFRINYFVQSKPEEAHASLFGNFSFTDLPAGASISSCRGYSQSAVATQPSSWGRIKATYR